MKFYLTDKNIATNREGVDIYSEGRHVLIYSKQGRKLKLVKRVDFVAGVIFTTYIGFITPVRWEAPFDNEVISSDELTLIKEHLTSAMTLHESQVDFESFERSNNPDDLKI